ncbi:hypothetical protein [Salana multivorans]
MILLAIVVCEVAFWVALVAGLATRYLLRMPHLGAALLIAAPVIDAVLLALVTVDLLRGGTASWQHGLAAIYIGVSIAYGRRMVDWADRHFAHRFAGGPRPERLTGTAYTLKCWRDVGLTLLMVAIAGAIIGGLVLLVRDPERTSALTGTFPILGLVLGIDLVVAVSYTIWPRKPERAAVAL